MPLGNMLVFKPGGRAANFISQLPEETLKPRIRIQLERGKEQQRKKGLTQGLPYRSVLAYLAQLGMIMRVTNSVGEEQRDSKYIPPILRDTRRNDNPWFNNCELLQ
ncbi:hypothetical protein B296_00019038 [Ensete ventricosum]|uniref:Uncharacterized protein n=1 Tax=Ensete ventricosum TaxID=4639 RepID=A0A427ALE2_ENSVE|nr:hypothetical protein B296_00019038 [Ensete ventricosum]